MIKRILSVLFAFLCIPVFSQDIEELKEKAELLLSYKEYEMAIPYFDSIIGLEPDSVEYIKKAGNCYLSLQYPDEAIKYYKRCLELDSLYNDAYYNLGAAYDMKANTDSAIWFFNVYNSLSPEDPNGFNRLSSIYLALPGMEDSAVTYAGKALDLDPSNASSYFSLAYAYFNNSRYRDALDVSLKGLAIDSSFAYLFLPAGMSSFFLEDYNAALRYFKSGWETQGFEENFAYYYAFALLMKNTHPGQYTKEDENIYFNNITSNNLDELVKSTKDPVSPYFYGNLLKKCNDRLFEMSLDEFIMLYIGFTGDPAYSPYSLNSSAINTILDKEDPEIIIREAEELAKKIPAHFPVYMVLAEAYGRQGNYQAQLENLYQFLGYFKSIKATGNGSSADLAIIVAFINHEYFILDEMGLLPDGQELFENKYSYDKLYGKSADDKVHEVYFNIDLAFSTLDMGDDKTKKTRKRRRNHNR